MLRSATLSFVLAAACGFLLTPACSHDEVCHALDEYNDGCEELLVNFCCHYDTTGVAKPKAFDACLLPSDLTAAGFTSCDFSDCTEEEMCSSTVSPRCAALQRAFHDVDPGTSDNDCRRATCSTAGQPCGVDGVCRDNGTEFICVLP